MTVFFVSAGAALTLSLVGKFLADAYLHEPIAIIGDSVALTYSLNPGVAFGLKLPAVVQELFIIAALALVCVLAWQSAKTTLSKIAYGLIIGGALGNIFDRLRDGFVTDFFHIGTFPIFNIADSFITVGVVFLLAEMLILNYRARY